ncbi:family 20 glycosylhydrolase [Arenibacter palladensis]|uniref:family 20 glycosylhydrolase n=1 Tax=Arenibacter palladensis TaxID=237373 RepID=UPI0026E2BA46|nr:family 20 glycosylhydrolase [Arenibacter palladensis]MDO6603840.1 family 20 glycosylhydrolase [Arenibacter palladensis]
MKKYVTLLCIALVVVACSNSRPTFKKEDISLVPKPVSFQLRDSSFEFNSATVISLEDQSQQKAANYLVGLFNNAAGYSLAVSEGKINEGLIFESTQGLKEGAYQLEVDPDIIRIKATDESGFFNAVQTLRQLLPAAIESKEVVDTAWFVPCVSIGDEPRFQWRGMHMDFSRHFFKMDEVKAFLDYMALYKLNTYHMHLTDDQGWRLEIKKYPLLTEKGAWRIPNNQDTICNTRAVENDLYKIDESKFKEIDGERMYGGFYTQEQIKEIVAYAEDRCITVIPEIDMPGHFKSAIDNYPFLSCNEESGWDTVFTYPACLGKETTYEFMKNILTEVVDLFPSKYVHIGGDEVNIKSWEQCPHCQKSIKENGLKDEHELQSHFNRDIEQYLQSKGKQLMGWDEIVRGGLTKDASMMWWRNWAPKAPQIAADNGNDIVVTTTAAYYFDYLNEGNKLERVYNYEPVPESFTPEQEEHVLGIQANLWSEWIPNFKRLQYQAFPRMFAVSETGWVAKKDKDFEPFNKSVQKQYDRLDVLDVHYYIPAVEGLEKEIAIVDSSSVTLKLAYPLEGVEIYYTLDGSVPNKNSLKYTDPFVVKDTGTIKARAYRGDIFNDLKSAKIVKREFYEALKVSPENKGLKRWVTKGKFKRVEDIKIPTTANWTAVDGIELGELKEETNFSIIYEGFFKAEKDAVYIFETQADGGSMVYLDKELAVDNGGYHGPRKRYGTVALKKGWHAISVRYKPSSNPRMIKVWYGVQGEPLEPIDISVLSH